MSRSWEVDAGQRPWEQAQNNYPRTITVKRPAQPSTVGQVAYQGVSQTTETMIVSNVAASVQIASSGRNTHSGDLPADSPGPIKWAIYLPGAAVPGLPLIMERDVVYDDLGRRFQVAAYEPTAIGAHIDAVRLLI